MDALNLGLMVLSGVLVVYAILVSRKGQNYRILQEDLQRRITQGTAAYDGLEQKLERANQALNESKSVMKDMEKAVESARQGRAEARHQIQQLQQRHDDQLAGLQRRVDHLGEENKALHEQLQEADARLADQANQLAKKAAPAAPKPKPEDPSKAAKIKQDMDTLHEQRRTMERQGRKDKQEIQRLKGILRQIDPKQIAADKRKLKKFEQLYNSMKGLRSLSDQRAENWEQALRHLAGHITDTDATEQPIGTVVGSALEKIGKSLVVDEFSAPPELVAAAEAEQPVESKVLE